MFENVDIRIVVLTVLSEGGKKPTIEELDAMYDWVTQGSTEKRDNVRSLTPVN